MREGFLVLLALDELEVLRAIRGVQEALRVRKARLGAKLLHLEPIPVEDRPPHALHMCALAHLLEQLDVGLVLDRH